LSRFYGSSIIFLLSAGISFLIFPGTAGTAVLVSLLLAYLVVFSLGVSVLRLNLFCRALCRGKTVSRLVSLTFDDGPDPVTTPAVLDVLAKYGVHAAFFCIGEKTAQYQGLARRIADEGHIIANHSYHHFWGTNFLRLKGLTREMAQTQEAIQGATGKTPAFFRPPMGLTNPHMARALRRNGLICVGWDVRPFDTGRTNRQVMDVIARKTRDGSIILLHDTARSPREIMELLEGVIAVLKDRGFSFSALDDLLGIEPYQEN
jgi:peptidoglycan/xylan/chitin deacetylase (PgdA/CDA1 family)